GIGRLAAAVNRGDGASACAVLGDQRAGEVGWRPAESADDVAALAADDHAAFRRFRVLAAHRRGPWGVETINRLVAETVAQRLAVPAGTIWYPGRPVLVTENDYT